MIAHAGESRDFDPEKRASGMNFATVDDAGVIEMVDAKGNGLAFVIATVDELCGLIAKLTEMRNQLGGRPQ